MIKKAFTVVLFLPIMWANAQLDDGLVQAKDLYDQSHFQEAIEAFNSYISTNDQNYLAYKLRGDCRQRINDHERAVLDYDTALSISKEDPRLYISRGAARMSLGKMKPAIKDFDRAIEMNASDADAWFNRGGARYLSFDNKNALKDLNEALILNPDHADALFIRGVIKGEMYDEAEGITDIERALSLKTALDGAQMSLAILFYELEEWENAIQAFGKVIAAKDKYLAEALYYRGDCKYNQGEKNAACMDWRASAEKGDDDAIFIVANYCDTDAKKVPKKRKKVRQTTITF